MKLTEFLLNRIFAPLVVLLLSSLVVGISSKIKTGDWMAWYGAIPKAAWISLGVGFLLWMIIIVIARRLRRLRELDVEEAMFPETSSPFGAVPVGKLKYAGVVWRISVPMLEFWDSSDALGISPSSMEVETPPRCPKCETQLEETRRFWGGYIWKCVRCDFWKKSANSFYREEVRVEKIARREWEKQRHQGTH